MEKQELIEELRVFEISKEILKAFEKVPREEFVLEKYRKDAYENYPLPIGQGQTISQPLMIADMMNQIDLRRGQKVLEIGSGSGYQAALLKEVVGEKGTVISVERISELVELAKKNLATAGYDIHLVFGDGTKGYEKEAPYDRIVVAAGAPDIPKPLVEQLKAGGIMAIPVGGRMVQELMIVEKFEKKVETRKSTPCVFVNLIGEHGWPESS